MKVPAPTGVVAVVQPFVPSYRRPLFDAIDERLAPHSLRLEVWHAQPQGRVAARGNAETGRWSVPIRQHRVSFGSTNVTFRNILSRASSATALVAGLASTNLETYALALDRRTNLMLWGHGRNFTTTTNRLEWRVEGSLCKRASHIFAYTDEGKAAVEARGIPPEDVTVLLNTTDTRSLVTAQRGVSADQVRDLRLELGLAGGFVGLFVGAFDEPKQLPLLFEAADLVHRARPDFSLLMAGAGPQQAYVASMASQRPYVRLLGRLDAAGLALMSHVVDALVMPGRVGLVAVDALALGLPLVTTHYRFHAPEASYLTDGFDSVWTRFDAAAYAAALVRLAGDAREVSRLGGNAALTGRQFSVEGSADRFVRGVLRGLGRP